MPVAKNTAHDVPFALVDVRTGDALTGANPSAYVCLDGGVQSSASGIITELGSGQYLYEGVASDFNADYTSGLLFTANNAVPSHVLFQMQYLRKDTAYDIPFLLIDVRNSLALTGASPSGVKCLDGSSQTAVAGSFVERGNGQYVFQATASDFGANDIAGFLITATNAVPHHLIIDLLESYSPTAATGDSPASILASYLIGMGIVTVPSASGSWPMWISHLLDTPDNATAIFNTTPIKDGRWLKTGAVFHHYGVEVLLRAEDEETGWTKCNNISGQFDSIQNNSVVGNNGTYTVHNVSRQGGINSLGVETGTKRRNLFSMNFVVSITGI